MLLDGSGISPEIVAGRGYRTVDRAGVPDAFRRYQRRPGLLVPMYSPDGITASHQLRPDAPRVRDGKVVKYETPGGTRCILDVHPRMRKAVGDPSVPLWITEGIKKADALTSRGLCTVGLIGVWNWQKDGELSPCWEHVALNGREVRVVFDSDVMTKEEVQLALERLVGALEARGAAVKVVYLPDDGQKVGVDDYLVAGGTVEALYALTRSFEASDHTRARLTRDGRLRAAVGALWEIYDGLPTTRNADHTRRTVFRVLVEEAEKRGKPVGRNVRIYVSGNDGALIAGTSQPTFSKHVRALEADGYLEIERPTDGSKANRYVLKTGGRAVGNMSGKSPATRERNLEVKGKESDSKRVYDQPYSQVRGADVPALRWSRTVASWVLVDGVRVCEVDYLARLGKKRQAIIEHVLGGTTIGDLMERFAGKTTRRRDFLKRTLGPLSGLDGGPTILVIDGDAVRLVDGWREALENARLTGQEQEATERQLVNYELKRAAFRARDRVKVDRHPANAGADGHIEELEHFEDFDGIEMKPVQKSDPVADPEPVEDFSDCEPKPIPSVLVRALRDYLDAHPDDVEQTPYWLGATLWAFDLFPGKSSPDEVRDALVMLELRPTNNLKAVA